MINVTKARAMAEETAREKMGWVVEKRDKYLSDYYIERPNCWIFFADDSIPEAPSNWLGYRTFAVSRLGAERLVYDLRDDPQKMSDYADMMSKYFETHDE